MPAALRLAARAAAPHGTHAHQAAAADSPPPVASFLRRVARSTKFRSCQGQGLRRRAHPVPTLRSGLRLPRGPLTASEFC